MALSTDLFDFDLPPELIAQYPAERRDASRMLVLERATGRCAIRPFPAIAEYLAPGDVLVFNDTRVMAARLFGRRVTAAGEGPGAKFEILLVAPLGDAAGRGWNALLKPGRRAKCGTEVVLLERDGSPSACGDGFTVTGKRGDGSFEIAFTTADLERLQARYGAIPLPPYIGREAKAEDAERYQTVYAERSGAVAAPTAGLHFTRELLDGIAASGVGLGRVTLHVGPGTFKPVAVADATRHVMHREEFELPEATAALINGARAAGRRVLAVGTTTVRTLESCADDGGRVEARSGSTQIFLYPPYRPRAADMLLTNFHLPKSTLLMLVSCFADREKVLAAYEYAIRERMRFYSYGDCMLLV